MHPKVQFYKKSLHLQPHPEGGYFKEIYRSAEKINTKCLPSRYHGDRYLLTSIYFLLEGTQVSKFHRLKSDEIWHFYDGSAARIYILSDDGKLDALVLGKEITDGQTFQTVIKHDHWFAAEVFDKNSFCLVGCNVSPGFEFEDFELADRNDLIIQFPQHSELIIKFT